MRAVLFALLLLVSCRPGEQFVCDRKEMRPVLVTVKPPLFMQRLICVEGHWEPLPTAKP